MKKTCEKCDRVDNEFGLCSLTPDELRSHDRYFYDEDYLNLTPENICCDSGYTYFQNKEILLMEKKLYEMQEKAYFRRKTHKVNADIYKTFTPKQKEYLKESICWWICQSEIDTISKIINRGAGSLREGIIYGGNVRE